MEVVRDLDMDTSKFIKVKFQSASGNADEVLIKKASLIVFGNHIWSLAEVFSPGFPRSSKDMPRLLAALAVAAVEAAWLDEQYPAGELVARK